MLLLSYLKTSIHLNNKLINLFMEVLVQRKREITKHNKIRKENNLVMLIKQMRFSNDKNCFNTNSKYLANFILFISF